jgi:hypothetical protein
MPTLPNTLILADFADLLQAAVPIIFMILYGIAQLVGAKQPQNKPKPAPRPRPAPEPIGAAPAARQAGQPATLEESLRREVEDFLKRAQGQQPQQPAQARPVRAERPRQVAPAARQARRPLRPEPQREPPPRRLAEPLRPALAPLASTPPPTPAPTLAPLGSGVAQHVSQHLAGTTAIAQHAQHLGSEVALADERMQAHLQERFTHKLGTLAPQAAAPDRRVAASPVAQQLVKLLTQPGGARQVIIASEILRRPDDRWQ